MASRFVSGGTLEKPAERDDEWLQAQQELEEKRRRREEDAKQQDGKSLYEVLQKNKAEKEEAFQESIKLKNQFRALNDDEVDFLDATLEATRAKEEAVKKETSEQLERFRQLREQAEKVAEHAPDASNGDGVGVGGKETKDDVDWNVGNKKRKRAKEKEGLKGVKIRRMSSTNDEKINKDKSTPRVSEELHKTSHDTDKNRTLTDTTKGLASPARKDETPKSRSEAQEAYPAPKIASFGLVGYGSADDSE